MISVDAKKKEEVGEYAQAGREWRPKGAPVKVRGHSFPGEQGGHAIRYGVCDAGASTGFVNVGTGHSTAAFAVEPVRRWRQGRLSARGAAADHLRRRREQRLEEPGLEDGPGGPGAGDGPGNHLLPLPARHRPGTSKWNKIGHRLFSQITIAGRGRPLTSHDVIIDTIAAVTTRTGLTVTAVLDGARYPTGTQISDELMQDLEDRALTRHGFHGEWNYTLLPALRPAPEPQPEPAPPPAAAARAAVLPALASPELTGLCRQDLAALAASPELPWAAAREQRLHPERGHSRRARTGPAAPFRYTLETRLPAAICHHRPGMPCSHIAALPGARHGTITPAVQAITNLPGSGHPALAPGPVRVRTPTDLRRHAAAAGITIPDPPPRGRLRK